MNKLSIFLSFLLAIVLLGFSFFYFEQKENNQLTVSASVSAKGETINSTTQKEETDPEASAQPPPTPREEKIIQVNNNGTLQPMELEEYIIEVVAGEVYPTYEPEALKAQAVAARTYLYYKMSGGGCANGGDICTNSAHCQAFKSQEQMHSQWGSNYEKYYNAIASAVTETAGEIIKYANKPICALYHSSSVGSTEDCVSVFGGSHPYLISVETTADKSEEELTQSLTLTKEEFIKKINATFDDVNIDSISIKISSYTAAGRVATVQIGEKTIKATALRTALGLRSTDFTFENNQTSITFYMKGHGHGVGMSQHGAQAMAQEGYDYKQILTHYYTGTTIEQA